MINNSNADSRSTLGQWFRSRKFLHWITRYAYIEIAVFLALAIAAYFLGRHILDAQVPIEGDVRSHIFKIQLLQDYLSNFSWPQWNPYWYHGIPEDQFYPPGFYFLGALLSFIVRNATIAYKIMLLLTMVLNGLAIFYFARRFLKFDAHLAIWGLIAYETSTPLLLNFMFGEGPNLLGWSVTIFFLTIYLSQVMDGKTNRLVYCALPGTLLGVAILIHPFPVIFAAIVLVIFHIVWAIHNRRTWKTWWQPQLKYVAGVVIIGALVGMYYWLPAMLTLSWSSPIYSFTKFMWPGGTIYLLAIIFLALTVTIATRYKVRGDPKLDTLLISFCVACALGFGGTSYLPFNLGSLVQEFRFATIIIPFLGILLILSPLKYKIFQVNTGKVVMSVVIGVFLTAFIVGVNQRESFASGFSGIANVNIGSLYQLLAQQFGNNFPTFAVTTLAYITVLVFFALSIRHKPLELGANKPAIVAASGVCLLLLTSFIPYINTDKGANINRLYQFVDNYEDPAYAQLMQAAQGGRTVVSMTKGYLVEGDSPVTFGQNYGVETVNGPYNQGDPKFFKITVHMEWSERWFNYEWTRENLMQESAAKYMFIRDSVGLPNNLNGMSTAAANTYGKILALNQTVSYANAVTPILIDVDKTREATEFFNILLPQGYKMVLVDIKDVPAKEISSFKYVIVDTESKIAAYPGKKAFLLSDDVNPTVTESQGIVKLNMPYLSYTDQVFYHGDEANGYMWLGWDSWPGAQLSADMQNNLNNASKIMKPYLDQLSYEPVNYSLNGTAISLGNSPGFTLVKDSYFPYWKSENNSIMSTSQGFMLLDTESANSVLNYKKPMYYLFASAFSALGLLAMVTVLIVLAIPGRTPKT